jgi:hypothetical protein
VPSPSTPSSREPAVPSSRAGARLRLVPGARHLHARIFVMIERRCQTRSEGHRCQARSEGHRAAGGLCGCRHHRAAVAESSRACGFSPATAAASRSGRGAGAHVRLGQPDRKGTWPQPRVQRCSAGSPAQPRLLSAPRAQATATGNARAPAHAGPFACPQLQ